MLGVHTGAEPACVYVANLRTRRGRQQQLDRRPRTSIPNERRKRVEPVVVNVAKPVPVTSGVRDFNEAEGDYFGGAWRRADPFWFPLG